MKDEKYTYDAHITRAYDGDTVCAEVDLGFGMTTRQTFRLARINAPEVKGEQKDKGVEARNFLRDRVLGRDVLIRTYKDGKEKYGRYLADIFYTPEDEVGFVKPVCLNDEMVNKGLAIYKTY